MQRSTLFTTQLLGHHAINVSLNPLEAYRLAVTIVEPYLTTTFNKSPHYPSATTGNGACSGSIRCRDQYHSG